MSFLKFLGGIIGFVILLSIFMVTAEELVPADRRDVAGIIAIIASVIVYCYIIHKYRKNHSGNASRSQSDSSQPSFISKSTKKNNTRIKYSKPGLDRIRYVRITFRDWNRNKECFDITYELSNPNCFERSGEFSLYPSGSYVYMIDSSFMVDKNLEKYKVSFLDSNKQELKDYNFTYYFDEFPNGEFANLVIHSD